MVWADTCSQPLWFGLPQVRPPPSTCFSCPQILPEGRVYKPRSEGRIKACEGKGSGEWGFGADCCHYDPRGHVWEGIPPSPHHAAPVLAGAPRMLHPQPLFLSS